MQEDFQQAVEAIEQVRCEATLRDDWATLAQLFSDELTFVHSTGYVHDKAGYLDFLRTRIKTLRISRPRTAHLQDHGRQHYGFRSD